MIRSKLASWTKFLLLALGNMYACGNKIDGQLRLQPVWPCDAGLETVVSAITEYCVSVLRGDGSELTPSCGSKLEELALAAEETGGWVRLKLEGRNHSGQPVARGVSVPWRLESGKEAVLSIPMALVGQFSLVAGDSGSCQRLPFKSGANVAVALSSGHLLVAGSPDPNDDASRGAFLLDPTNNRLITISTPASMRRMLHGLALLEDGRVVLLGGADPDGRALSSVLVLRGGEIFLQHYDAGLDYGMVRFEESSNSLVYSRFRPVVSVFFGDQVLINDGEHSPEMWLGSQEASGVVSVSGQDPFPITGDKSAARVVAIDSRRAAVLGGPANHAGLLEVVSSQRSVSFGAFAVTLDSRHAPLGLHLGQGWAMFLGGKREVLSANSPVVLLDSQTGTLYEVPVVREEFPHLGYTATLLPDGRVLVAGGQNPSVGFVPGSTFILYRSGDNMWQWQVERGPSLRLPRTLHTASLLPDGRVLMVGGGSADAAVPHETVLGSAEVIAF